MAGISDRKSYSRLQSDDKIEKDARNRTDFITNSSGSSNEQREEIPGIFENAEVSNLTGEDPRECQGVVPLEEATQLEQWRYGEVPREVCDAVLQRLHIKMRRQLNFKHIWPFLNGKKLLAAHSQAFFMDPTKSENDKCDFLLASLPDFLDNDYLTPFKECLEESHGSTEEFGVGDAHIELVQEINSLLEMEMIIYRDSLRTTTKVSWCKKHKLISTVTPIVFITLLVAALTVVVYYFAWGILPNTASYQLIGHDFIVLDDNIINNQFISSLNIKWNNNSKCVGHLYLLNDQNCSQSSEVIQHQLMFLDKRPNYLPFYLMKNSVISIFVPNNTSVLDKRIIITQDVKEYLDDTPSDSDAIFKQCDVFKTMTCKSKYCYSTNNYLGQIINVTIDVNGFYNILLISTKTDDKYCILPRLNFGVRYDIHAITINETFIINNRDGADWTQIEIKKKPENVPIFQWFHFNKLRCNVLNYTCPRDNASLFYISKGYPRVDVLVILAVVDVVVILIAASCFIIFMHFKLRDKKIELF